MPTQVPNIVIGSTTIPDPWLISAIRCKVASNAVWISGQEAGPASESILAVLSGSDATSGIPLLKALHQRLEVVPFSQGPASALAGTNGPFSSGATGTLALAAGNVPLDNLVRVGFYRIAPDQGEGESFDKYGKRVAPPPPQNKPTAGTIVFYYANGSTVVVNSAGGGLDTVLDDVWATFSALQKCLFSVEPNG